MIFLFKNIKKKEKFKTLKDFKLLPCAMKTTLVKKRNDSIFFSSLYF